MKKLIIFLGLFLFAKTFYVHKGWNLLGTDEDINVTNFNVKIIWKYKDGNWSYFSKFYKLNYPKIDKINKNEGFWIYANKNIIFSNKKVLILPLYFYDLNKWKKIENISNDEIVIINPLNGSGNKIDKNYENLIKNLSNKVPIGYITSDYSNKSLEEIKKEIDNWINLYPDIKGFFIDEVNKNNYEYYKKIYEYIKSKTNYLVVLNPGTKVNLNYFNIADIIVVYEGANANFSDYCNDFPQKSAIMIYNANEEIMKNTINSKCRYIFISDKSDNNYLNLPDYFDEELNLLK